MTPLRIRLNPFAAYLLMLAVYSCLMCISTIKQQQQQEQHRNDRDITRRTSSYDNDSNHGRGHFKLQRRLRVTEPPKFVDVEDFYAWLASPETSCRKMTRFGGTSCRRALDFEKGVCMDADVALDAKNCTVYSFGIGHDSTFDDACNHYGCEVFMFDPTINVADAEKQLLKREKFSRYGLDSHHHKMNHIVTYLEDNSTETIEGLYYSYDEIKKRIGHQDRVVHYLKLDIENTEWKVISYLVNNNLLSGVKQLAIEIHTMDIIKMPHDKVLDTLHDYAKILTQLKKEGFHRVYYRPNLVLDTLYHMPGENRSIPTCAEVLYLRRGHRL